MGFGYRVYRDYMGIMENKVETTIVYWGLYGDNGKENGKPQRALLLNERISSSVSVTLPLTALQMCVPAVHAVLQHNYPCT